MCMEGAPSGEGWVRRRVEGNEKEGLFREEDGGKCRKREGKVAIKKEKPKGIILLTFCLIKTNCNTCNSVYKYTYITFYF